MSNFFNLDAPIWEWLTELADVMLLSLYWWICSIPLITIGASTTSLFYVLGKKVRKESTYVTKDFFRSFKDNFKQSILISIILVIAWISAILYFLLARDNLLQNRVEGIAKFITPLALVFIFETLNISMYVCAILSRFHMKTYAIFTTAFILAHKHFFTTLMMTASVLVTGILLLKAPIIILIVPGVIVGLISFLIQKIFNKYMSNETAA